MRSARIFYIYPCVIWKHPISQFLSFVDLKTLPLLPTFLNLWRLIQLYHQSYNIISLFKVKFSNVPEKTPKSPHFYGSTRVCTVKRVKSYSQWESIHQLKGMRKVLGYVSSSYIVYESLFTLLIDLGVGKIPLGALSSLRCAAKLIRLFNSWEKEYAKPLLD